MCFRLFRLRRKTNLYQKEFIELMQTAVIYARYSSDSQTEQSIDGQLRVCEEYAKSHNILLLDTYIDRAMTGTNDNRPDFQRMIKDSSRREWNYVLVYKLDRFSRNKYETAIHKKTLRDNGVKVLSAMENIPDTPEGIILESLLDGMNQYYSAELSQKVKRGMKETRLKGLYQGGGLPYGYRVEQRKVVIDETTADTVRFMYEQYSKGVYVKEIISQLTNKGILYKGKPFAPNTVYGILANEKYSGVYMKDGETVDNIYPQLISTDIYKIVRAKVEQNKFGKRSIKAVYLLRHKVKCGYCGRPISAETGTARNGDIKRYYKCIGRKKDNNGCIKTQIPKDFLEEFVTDSIIQVMTEPKNLDNIVTEIMKRQNKDENGNLKMLTNEKHRIDRALENLVNAIENGIVSNTTNKRLHDLEKQQEQLERQILIERSKTAVKLSESDIRQYYEQALKLETKMLINFLIKEIVLYNDKIEIYFNAPIKQSPDDDNRDFLFYSNYGNLHYKVQNVKTIQNRKMQVEMYIV